MSDLIATARDLRNRQTKTESLLWAVLRNRQVCGLKFRRQHPIDPWVVDFACVQHMLAVEIDGGYHDYVVDKDLRRQRDLESRGWRVLRFSDEDVKSEPEAVAIAIAQCLGLDYRFSAHRKGKSGSRARR